MKRNQDLIVRTMDHYYELILNKELINPQIYITQKPHSKEEQFLCQLKGNYMMIPDPLPGKRVYFIIKSENHDNLVSSVPYLNLPHIENFRDMGGYIGAGSKTVKWGIFYRSGALSGLSDWEKSYVDELNLRYILDYRTESEAARAADYISDHTSCHNISAFAVPKKPDSLLKDADMSARLKNITTMGDLEQLIEEFKGLYCMLPFQNPAYMQMFQYLKAQQTPFIQHCAAGKDRTGTGCALLLLALGVDKETVIGDYLLSAAYRENKNKKSIKQLLEKGDILPEAADSIYTLLSVQREYIETAFQAIEEKYSTFEEYLFQEYQITGSDLENWRSLYLY